MITGSNGSQSGPTPAQLPLPLKLLGGLMRRLPTDIRRADVIWQGLYRRIGGGGFSADDAVDRSWPRGLQPPVRGTHRLLMRLNLQNWCRHLPRVGDAAPTRRSVCRRRGQRRLDVAFGPQPDRRAGRGVAFEPNPTAFARLKDHFEMNGVTNFELVPRAVADCESVQWLFVPSDEMLLGTFVPERAEGTRVEVRTEPADRYVAAFDSQRPTLIKIDVEGYEVQVLRGIQSLLARPNVIVVTEIADAKLRRAGHSREELHAILDGFGFVPHTIDVRATRWQKDLQLSRLPGPLNSEEYDALFAKPDSAVFRDRIAPLLAR